MTDRFPELVRSADKLMDARGWLQVLYESKSTVLKRSFSHRGVFRGLHIQQPPSPQVKLIRVVEGRIMDFVVDLSDERRVIHQREITPADEWILIDTKYAHGFLALNDSLFEYVCDGGYDERREQTFSILPWLEDQFSDIGLLLSPKDRGAPPL